MAGLGPGKRAAAQFGGEPGPAGPQRGGGVQEVGPEEAHRHQHGEAARQALRRGRQPGEVGRREGRDACALQLLALALDCIPPAHLRLFFTRLLRDLKANRTGLPDLVRFWPAARRYELVEVKAPGDKLQDNQIRWLAYCEAQGIPVRAAAAAQAPA